MADQELTVILSKAWSAIDALQLSGDPDTRSRARVIREALRRLDRPHSVHNLIAGGGEPPAMWLELFLFEYKRLVPFFTSDPVGIQKCQELGTEPLGVAVAAAIANATRIYDTAYGVFHAGNSDASDGD